MLECVRWVTVMNTWGTPRWSGRRGYLAELQVSPQVGHFSHSFPEAPGTEHTHWPQSQCPRPLQDVPSWDMHASVLLLQLQYSPSQPLSHTH